MAAKRLLVVGGGKAEKFSAAELRNVTGAAVRYLKSKSGARFALALDPAHAAPEYATAAAEGAILGDYEPDQYKTATTRTHVELRWWPRRARRRLDDALDRGRSWPKRRTSPARWPASRPTG